MSLEAAFHTLGARLKELEEAFDELLWAVVHGQPAGGHALADYYDEAATDLVERVKEAHLAVVSNLKQRDGAHDDTADTLALCHESFNLVSRRFYGDLACYERVAALKSVCAERKEEWGAWSHGVQDSLQRCAQPLDDVAQALFHCWLTLTGANSPARV